VAQDFRNNVIIAGSTIAYPTRKGALMEMHEATVTCVFPQGEIEVTRKEDNRKVRLLRSDRVAVLGQ
jgi:hypothetical protein